ncbi:MAG: hypothetical protein ONB16_09055 [candidate division KSB1 bacterium]|nr:hypothetical protein [candidate division KSB1 bacterium]MDZ7319176.1 hypothetical protein [candidate division KSB1 bacterium]MDZ7339767.1 hypothetical protein [candidate division KSB1 bacterium]
MKKMVIFILLGLMGIGPLWGQERYPKFYETGARINFVPDVNVYVISETQFNKTLETKALLDNCEQRLDVLKMKVAQQDSIIALYRAKEANYDSTLTHTRRNLDLTMGESEACQKELAKQKVCKKRLAGIAGLEALVLILVIAL